MTLSTMQTLVKAKAVGSGKKYKDLMPSEENFVHVKVKKHSTDRRMVTKIEIALLNFAKIE